MLSRIAYGIVFVAVLNGSFLGIAKAGEEGDFTQPGAMAPASSPTRWGLRVPKQDGVKFQGVVSFDDAGAGRGQILYMAPNALSMIAEVLTHGAIVESVKSNQKTKLQENADKVLQPYQPVLSQFRCRDLVQRALPLASLGADKYLQDGPGQSSSGWLIETSPTYSLSQDQRVIVLDNPISIFAANKLSVPAYQNRIRVVSKRRDEADILAYWTASDGEHLKEESAALFAESLEVARSALERSPPKDAAVFKTFRYREGDHERMERGQLFSESCDRQVIQNLRGWLMSIPKPDDSAEECPSIASAKLQSSAK